MKKVLALLLLAAIVCLGVSAESKVASTMLVLSFVDTKVNLWFSKIPDNSEEKLTGYDLSLTLSGDEQIENVQAFNEVYGEGSDLYLNWQITSQEDVGLSLFISEPLTDSSNCKLGWSVEWEDKSITQDPSHTSNEPSAEEVVKKDAQKYFSFGHQRLVIKTDDVFSLKPGRYSADLTALVKTIG